MEAIEAFIEANVWSAWVTLAISFVILAKCADLFVDAAVALAEKLSIPKLIIGIVLVSLATTAPELAVSLLSAMKGNPEMALGNAIGSVICDDGLALALAGLFAAAPIAVMPKVLKTSGLFLLFIEIVCFIFIVGDHTLNRIEGGVLVALFIGYMIFLYRNRRAGGEDTAAEAQMEEVEEIEKETATQSGTKIIALFILALAGIILSSDFVVISATSIAHSFGIPEAVIALTIVALGTSIPEVATCIMAARKGHGEIAIGNILGADIMNICWVAGASSLANPLTLQARELYFMFPAMFIIVAAMLVMLRHNYNLTKAKGGILLFLYAVYVASFFYFFAPGTVGA